MNAILNKPALLSAIELGGFSLDFKGSLVLILLLVISATALSVLVYRRTLPPSGIVLRFFLAVLRLAALAVIIFLIFEPSISFHRQRQLKPLLAVILDNSESMRLTDASGDRFAQLNALFDDPAWEDLEDRFELAIFASGDSLRRLIRLDFDSLNCRAIGTNLAAGWDAALKALDPTECAACLVISDGGNNAGRDPVDAASEAPRPIFTIGIGDTAGVRDARIESLIGSEIAYLDKPAQIMVSVKAFGMDGQDAHLELLDPEGRILARRPINLPPDELKTEIALEFTPKKVGQYPLRVRLVTSEQEHSSENNLRTFPLDVLESLLKIVMISGRSSFEAMFFQRAAAEVPDLETIALTVGKDGQFYADRLVDLTDVISDADVLVLIDFPERDTPAASRSILQRTMANSPLPTWVWLGDNPSLDELEDLCGALPFAITRVQRLGEAEAHPDRFYTVLDPDVEAVERALWYDLPPLQTPNYSIKIQGTASQLLEFRDPESGQPLGPALLSWELEGRRNAVFFGHGYWRWNFMGLGPGGDHDLYTGLQSKILRWLAAGPQKRLLYLSPDKKLYSSGQAAEFRARVQSGSGQPISNAHVDLTVQSPDGEVKILLEPDQHGFYSGSFQPTAVGTHSFSGIAKINEDTLGFDSGRFDVEAYNIEKEALSQNRELLEQIAEASGGSYLPADSLAVLVRLIQAQPRLKETGWNRRFFLNWDFWIVIILLLGLEWFIRKRRGML